MICDCSTSVDRETSTQNWSHSIERNLLGYASDMSGRCDDILLETSIFSVARECDIRA